MLVGLRLFGLMRYLQRLFRTYAIQDDNFIPSMGIANITDGITSLAELVADPLTGDIFYLTLDGPSSGSLHRLEPSQTYTLIQFNIHSW